LWKDKANRIGYQTAFRRAEEGTKFHSFKLSGFYDLVSECFCGRIAVGRL
jgi:hypothetical protein